jgi:hypothetical protein
MASMFFIAFAAAAAGLMVVLFTPPGTIKQIENRTAEESWEL